MNIREIQSTSHSAGDVPSEATLKRRGRAKKTPEKSVAINPGTDEPQRYRREKKPNYEQWIIPVSAGTTGALTMLAAPQLITVNDVLDGVKIVLLGGAAAFVSGIVNHYAIKTGAELAGRGFVLAGAGSVIPIVAVGLSASVFGYSGLVLGQVNDLNRQEHAQALHAYLDEVNGHVVQSLQLKPAVESAASDIQAGLACELTEGCLSGGIAGKGAVYRAVLPLASRASDIFEKLETADKTRQDRLARASTLIGQYESALSDSELSSDERIRKLTQRSAQVKEEVEALRQGLPSSLFASYANELTAGVKISGKPEATSQVNGMLARHGAAISDALDGLKPDKSVSPAFPGKAGVSQAIDRLGSFWPIAMLTFAIELTIPVVLWLFAYLGVVWALFKHENPVAKGSSDAL